MNDEIEKAKKHFEEILVEQLERVEKLKEEDDWVDYTNLKPIIIGILGGDGIGPEITKHARTIFEFLLQDHLKAEK